MNPGKTSRQEGPTLRHLVLTSLSRKLAQFWATKDLKHFTPLQGDVPATFRCPTPSQTSQTLLKHSSSVICSQLIKFPSVRGNRCSKACSINVLFMTYVLFIISLFIINLCFIIDNDVVLLLIRRLGKAVLWHFEDT